MPTERNKYKTNKNKIFYENYSIKSPMTKGKFEFELRTKDYQKKSKNIRK